jgi:Family of unknown function (DUF6489)
MIARLHWLPMLVAGRGLGSREDGDIQAPVGRRRERRAAMKISFNLDCTPEEARQFFALPEVRPMQEALLHEIQERLTANIRAMDAKSLIETWLPSTLKGLEQLQQMFFSQMATGPGKKP